ncbi:alpha/beta hydrolase [Pyxidicoccus sp. MSG2]|uniref:alpha/beta hydrolase n=1 Tax=Pyxidicoccus sp. MSG2 TaxID=2996790 RepID=UPI00226E0276|nr:dienelactone hydrolase family protein [Pyxidicoccus sp. MSG2]MCY1022484.1 dienelactone hydrolase family protein [Pyxidicoccus sp. MSG2]
MMTLSLACAGPRAGATAADTSQQLVHETYTLGGEQPEALLVALHYSGSTPAFWNEYVKDWGAPVRVLLPQGPLPRREGFTWFAPGHEQKDEAAKLADVEQMAARVADLIREVRRAHPELRHVGVTGFSYGGDLAWFLAIRYPELVDVAVPMGSRLLGDPTRALPATSRVRVLQGEADAIIDARKTVERVEALKAGGVPIDLRTYPGLGHDVSPELIEDWRAFLRQGLSGTAAVQSRRD